MLAGHGLGQLAAVRVDAADEPKERVGGALVAVALLQPVGHVLRGVAEGVLAMEVGGDGGGVLDVEDQRLVLLDPLLHLQLPLGEGVVHVDLGRVLLTCRTDPDSVPAQLHSLVHRVVALGELDVTEVPPAGYSHVVDPTALDEDVVQVLLLDIVGQTAHKDGVAAARLVSLLWLRLVRRRRNDDGAPPHYGSGLEV